MIRAVKRKEQKHRQQKHGLKKFPEEYAKQVNLNPMKRFGDPEIDDD